MTLIVGIKCTNGIVIGADGAATMSGLGQPTAIQPYVKKLTICHQCVVVGVSGSVGIGQRLTGIASDIFGSGQLSGGVKAHEAMKRLREAFWTNCLGGEYQVATVAAPLNQSARMVPICSAVVALPINGSISMIQFDSTGAPEMATKELLFLAIGSGQNIADPFLAFIRRIFWSDHQPTVAEGQFAVWWTLHHAVKAAPSGITDPKQIVVLEHVKKAILARELTQDDMREHEDAVNAVEEHLRQFRKVTSESMVNPGIPPAPINLATKIGT